MELSLTPHQWIYWMRQRTPHRVTQCQWIYWVQETDCVWSEGKGYCSLRQSEQTEVRQPRLGRWCVHGGESCRIQELIWQLFIQKPSVKTWEWGWVKAWQWGLEVRLGQDHRWGCTRVCTRLGMFLYTPDRCCGIHVQEAATCSQSLNYNYHKYYIMW